MAQPLPNGVHPEASVVGGGYLYVAGYDSSNVLNLYKVSTDTYTVSGTAVVFCALTGVYGLEFMTIDETNHKLYISDNGDGNPGSVWVVNLNDGTFSQFVTGLLYPKGLAVYGGYLYVTTNDNSVSESENQITLLQIDLNNSSSQTSLLVGVPSTYYSQQMVVHNYSSPTALYCYFLCNGFDIDLGIPLTRITQVDLTGFSPSSSYTLNYFTIDTTLISDLSSVGSTLVYNPSAGDFLSFVYSTTTHNFVIYIAQVDITNPSSPSLSSSDYIPAISNLTKYIYSVAVDSSGNFIIDFYDSYQIYGLPNYLELTYDISAGYPLTLPISTGGTIIEVNWGDTTINTSISHTYSTAGTYTILVNASGITQLNQTLGTGAQYLTSCSNFGDIGLTNLSHAFDGCTNLTVAPNSLPLLSTITNMSYMFQNATSFNQALGWGSYVSSVTDISNMFNGATLFNQSVNGWFFQNVTNMSNMFKGASAFNNGTETQFYFTVNTTSPVNMSGMFQNAVAFNQSINYTAFITSAVTDMSNMFNGAVLFNDSNVNGFNVSNVTNMSGMFQGASAFNNALSSWDVSNVTDMSYMFQNATSFNRDISTWDISAVTNIISMLDVSGLSVGNYDNILSVWSTLSPTVQSSLSFAGYGLVYSPFGETGHTTLATTKSWMFYGDALVSTDEITKNVPFELTVNVTPSTFTSGNEYQLYYLGSTFSDPVIYDGSSTTLPTFYNLQFTTNVYRAAIVLKNNTTNTTVTTYYLSTGGPLVLYYEIPITATFPYELRLPFLKSGNDINGGTINKIVWGDETTTTSQTVVHSYSAYGNYTIKVYGSNIPYLRYSYTNSTGESYLIRCDSFGEIGLTDMSNAFNQCSSLTTVPADLPFSSNVTSTYGMFDGAGSFNDVNITTWNVSTVVNMGRMFYTATTFNQDLSSWNVSNVTNVYSMFENAYAFNNGNTSNIGSKPLSWGSKTSNFTSTGHMFFNASSFNQSIRGWDVSKITGMDNMFYGATSFNNGDTTDIASKPLSWTTTTNVTSTYGMFNGATNFNQSIDGWNLSNITTMYQMFNGAQTFNNGGAAFTSFTLNLTNPINMSGMFQNATSFNQDVTVWDVSRVTNMSNMFNSATSFNNGDAPLSWTTTTSVTDMSQMFYNATSFNQNVTGMDVTNVTNMSSMFTVATSFNNGGVALNWTTTTNVTDMSQMFYGASAFNVDVSDMVTTTVTNMSNMFNTATIFNNGGTALSWTTTSVTSMSYMFYGAVAFNQDISGWDVSNVTSMTLMFNNATLFDQNLGSWNISSVTEMSNMLNYTGLSTSNYNSTLNGWAALTRVPYLIFGGYGLVYSPAGQTAHNTISATPWYFDADALVSTDTVIQGTSFDFTINVTYLSGDNCYLTYSGKTSETVSSSGGTIPFTGLVFTENGNHLPVVLHTPSGSITYYLDVYSDTVVCFNEGTKILTDKGYVPIQDLRNGDLVKTLLDDYKPIFMIAKREIYHSALEERIKDQLYKCTNEKYPEIFEDLIITGCHSMLVNNFKDDTQREATSKILGQIYVTDDKYRLPICLDEKAEVYEKEGKYTVYHIALENENYTWNYGIFANGLLVETCSKRYLKERSGMTVIE